MKIVDLEVNKVKRRLQMKEIEIELDQTAHEFVIEKGYDPTYGARPMRRAVERYLEDPLAEELLRGGVKAGDLVNVTVENGKLVFKAAEPQQSAPASAS
jgi:ATP-dependent Clp protease ATP-binding subunit ClpC